MVEGFEGSRNGLHEVLAFRVNVNQTKLYVTDSSATDSAPTLYGGADGTGSPAV